MDYPLVLHPNTLHNWTLLKALSIDIIKYLNVLRSSICMLLQAAFCERCLKKAFHSMVTWWAIYINRCFQWPWSENYITYHSKSGEPQRRIEQWWALSKYSWLEVIYESISHVEATTLWIGKLSSVLYMMGNLDLKNRPTIFCYLFCSLARRVLLRSSMSGLRIPSGIYRLDKAVTLYLALITWIPSASIMRLVVYCIIHHLTRDSLMLMHIMYCYHLVYIHHLPSLLYPTAHA